LEIREKIFDKYDTAIAISCNNLGRFYSTIAEYNKALFYLERSLSIRKKSDKVGKHLAVVYNNIGIVYQKMGQYPKALKAYEESLNLRKKIFGIDSPKTAIAYNSIGNLYELIED
jgi:tetratricopeptide (TPR) repeat protein